MLLTLKTLFGASPMFDRRSTATDSAARASTPRPPETEAQVETDPLWAAWLDDDEWRASKP